MFQRSRRGFSVIEVIVAASLAVGLGMIVSVAISTSSTSSKDAIIRAAAAEEVRRINDLLTRYVQGAVPRPVCKEPSNLPAEGMPFASCIIAGTDGLVFESVSASKIVFYSYPEGSRGGADPVAPEQVTVEAVRNATDGSVTLSVSSVSVPVATPPKFYVGSANYAGVQPQVVRATVLVTPEIAALDGTQTCQAPAGTPGPQEVFAFFDANAAATADASKVSVIAFDPRVKVPVADEPCPRTVSSPVFLTLPSQGFGR